MLGDLQGKNVLEFGCSIGTITRTLAKKVLPGGKIYAFDIIKHNIKVASNHLRKKRHVNFYYHDNLINFKPKMKLPKCDVLISAGTLSYLQKPQTVLRNLGENIKSGGRVVFMDYDKFFFFIPNVPWISDEKKLRLMFRKAGFDVQVTKKKGLFWQYVYISGKKI